MYALNRVPGASLAAMWSVMYPVFLIAIPDYRTCEEGRGRLHTVHTCMLHLHYAALHLFQVFALWYRPPELIFGSTCYGFAIDVWAAGCLFAGACVRYVLCTVTAL
jgi:hypothetical protein